jgi:hypothetical protein
MTTLLLLKLVLTPLLIGMVSMVGRRWGPIVSGWMIGLPLTSGPVALFLALEQGTGFAAQAAQSTLLGLISLAVFCLVYSWLALHNGWVRSLLGSWSAFLVVTLTLHQVTAPLLQIFLGGVSILFLAYILLPPHRQGDSAPRAPQWEIPVRMLVATTFVVALTELAGVLGPQLSGLLSPFPIFATILSVFAHRFQGGYVAGQVLRGVVAGTFSFAVFFVVLGGLIVPWGIAPAFGCAILATLLTQGGSLRFLRRINRQVESA